MARRNITDTASEKAESKKTTKRSFSKRLSFFLIRCAVGGVVLPIITLILAISSLKVSDIPVTIRMVIQNQFAGPITQETISIDTVPKHVVLAFIAAEDANFCQHWGFDIFAIRASSEGEGSSISQQTASNLFLWSSNNGVTRFIESVFTGGIELILSKRRIMEIYLNTNRFRDDVIGISEASKEYYAKKVSELNQEEAAELAAKFADTTLTNNLQQRIQTIQNGAVLMLDNNRSNCIEI